MGINFPSSNDVFTEPSAPSSTPLGSGGDSARDNTENHEDLGLAVMALQAEATLLTHSHNGSTRQGPKLLQATTHQSPDTDASAAALHHTIGTGANQGAAGNHTHGAPDVWPIGSIFITELTGDPASVHGLPGTWTQITGVFLVAAGSTFTGGSTGGNTTHLHTASFSTAGSHTHTAPSVDSAGDHSHTNSTSGTSTFSHTHGTSGSSSSTLSFHWKSGSGTGSMNNSSHNHTVGSSDNTSHSHSVSSATGVGGHQHTLSAMDSQGGHSHTSAIASSGHIPPYLSVNVWERTA